VLNFRLGGWIEIVKNGSGHGAQQEWEQQVRLFRIRKARINAKLRDAFEEYGVGVMQQILAARLNFYLGGQQVHIEKHIPEVQAWLKEKADGAGRIETWHLILEIAITILVAGDLLMWFIHGGHAGLSGPRSP
jgi:hypothetical protein